MKVPVIGESVNEVTLSQWLKGNGDYVKLDEPICEFESDKATLEFPAEAAGKLIYVAAEGDDLEIGALVATIDTSVAAETSEPTATPAPARDRPVSAADCTAVRASAKRVCMFSTSSDNFSRRLSGASCRLATPSACLDTVSSNILKR